MGSHSIIGCGNSEKFHSKDLNDLKLYGSIQTIVETSYEAKITPNGKPELGKIASPSWQKNNRKEFDKNGKLVESKVYKLDGSIKNTIRYEHDKNQQLIKEHTFMANGDLLYTKTFIYNEMDKISRIQMVNSEHKILAEWILTYDQDGKKIEEDQYFPDRSEKPVIRSIFKYDENGNKIQEHMYNPEDRLIVRWLSKYDGENRLIEENYYYSDGSLNSKENYEYEYDSHGNWIKQIVYENDNPKFIIERTISYY